MFSGNSCELYGTGLQRDVNEGQYMYDNLHIRATILDVYASSFENK